MPEWLDPVVALTTGWGLTYLLHSTVLIGLVWLAVALDWVRSPEAKDFLWKFALLAGVVSAVGVSVPSSVSFAEGDVRGVRERVVMRANPVPGDREVHVEVARFGSLPEHISGESAREFDWTDAGDVGMDSGLLAFAALDDATEQGSFWGQGLLALWLFGSGVLLIGLGRDRLAVRDLKSKLEEPGERARSAFDRVVSGTRVRPVLKVSSSLDAPCVLDGRTIALPRRCEEHLTDEELLAVLAHEVAHIARHDVAWLTAGRVASALFWLQPLNRVALNGLIDAAELVCDDWALRRTRQPLGLARSISRVAEWAALPSERPQTVVAMAGGNGRSLSNRVRRILTGGAENARSPRWKRWLGAAALIVPVLLLPAIPGAGALHATVLFAQENVMVKEIGGDLHEVQGAVRVQLRIAEGARVDPEWTTDRDELVQRIRTRLDRAAAQR